MAFTLLHRLSLWCACVLLGAGLHAAEQAPAPAKTQAGDLAIVLASGELVTAANFQKTEELAYWLAMAKDACSELLKQQPAGTLILVQVNFRPDKDPVFEYAGRPEPDKVLVSQLNRVLKALPPLRSRVCEVCVRLQTEEGSQMNPFTRARSFLPTPQTPEERALEKFKAAELGARLALVRGWVRERALPLIARGCADVDPKFAGVRGEGVQLLKVNPAYPVDAEGLTYRNSTYWRGVMEMVPGNHQIALVPVLLFAANGELDKASRLLSNIIPFADQNTLASKLEQELMQRLGLIDQQVKEAVRRGIALHDQGQYDKAMAVYQELLRVYPCSAWARYELFYSELHKGGSEAVSRELANGGEAWTKAAREIYRRDPLYTTQFRGEKGRDSGALLARQSLRAVSEKKGTTLGEYVGCLTDSAMKLECYGHAAELYWLALNVKVSLVEPGEAGAPGREIPSEEMLCRFLYAMHKLGCTEVLGLFKNEYQPFFSKLDKELAAFRKQ